MAQTKAIEQRNQNRVAKYISELARAQVEFCAKAVKASLRAAGTLLPETSRR